MGTGAKGPGRGALLTRTDRLRALIAPSGVEPEGASATVARAVVFGLLVLFACIRIVPGAPYVGALVAGVAVDLLSGTSALRWVASLVVGLVGAVALLAAPGWTASTIAPVAVSVLCVAGTGLGFLLRRARVDTRLVALAVVAVLVFSFTFQGLRAGTLMQEGLRTEPAAEAYSFDPVFFLKVFYLVDHGTGFYQAYGDAFAQDARFSAPTADVAGWRSPVVFRTWALLADNGLQILYLFIFLAALSMVLGYYVAMRISDHASALIVPAFLCAYYFDAIRLVWFFELEFWATFAVIIALTCMYARVQWAALGFSVWAGMSREWLISSTLAGFAQATRDRKWKWMAAWGAGVVAVVALYVANSALVRGYLRSVGITPQTGTVGRLGQGGASFILYTLKFCTAQMLQPAVLVYTALALALVGCFVLLRRGELYLPLLLLLPLAAFMVFGSANGRVGAPAGWNDYYNAAYMPFLLILASASWRVLPTRAAKDRGRSTASPPRPGHRRAASGSGRKKAHR